MLGGDQCAVFSDYELGVVFEEVMLFLSKNQHTMLADITQHLQFMFDRKVQQWTTSRLLKKMGWSWKIPVR